MKDVEITGEKWSSIREQLDGELRDDRLHRLLYAQDASVYQEEPQGVAFPRNREDVQALVKTANTLGVGLIPRAGGTSLAGQCVGDGIVVDTGRHMNRILEVNEQEGWVRVEPGVILDDLNRYLEPYDLYFGPDTSTSNRCMIGGMIGNNSCGSHSILFGNTRSHLLEVGVVFADGEYAEVGDWDRGELEARMEGDGRLAEGLRKLYDIGEHHGELIEERYPRRDVLRRNTGYALDEVVRRAPHGDEGPFALQKLLCGSEGTLGLVTEAKLNLVERPKKRLVVCAHFHTLEEALKATVRAVNHDPAAVELMDRRVLEATKNNIEQSRNRFWVEGDPGAVLVVEFYRQSDEELEAAVDGLVEELKADNAGYAYPVVRPPKDKRVWDLRKAGLGLLMGIEGDVKPVTVVEDTAVAVDVLPDYVRDFSKIMDAYDTACVYYAHASVGELHLRPELNLKDPEDVERFKGIAEDVADLVKRYEGSLSGEHGDGRVRSPLLERFYGPEVMELHRDVKTAFDPDGIFNPGNIVDPRPIDADFRFETGRETPEVETYFHWNKEQGLVRATELCNGAGVCRKRAESGGTMCPSYMATLDEKDSTRGRANIFRTLLTDGPPEDAFESDELGEALDLCLSCKGCKSECPASVDMAKMKAEYLQQRYDRQGTPMAARFFAYFGTMARLGSITPRLANWMLSLGMVKWILEAWFGVSSQRDLPQMATSTFDARFKQYRREQGEPDADAEVVWLYVDPFTDFTEPEVGIDAVRVLEALGYRVERFGIRDDGRTYLSKGLVKKGRRVLERGLEDVADELENHRGRPVIGLEPSALLTFRDEMTDLVDESYREEATRLGERAVLFEEFLAQQLDAGEIDTAVFDDHTGRAVLHGHCHQKAMVGTAPTRAVLEAVGFDVDTLQTGCCGMAGSFGYESEHYEVSMDIGELVLFPALRELEGHEVVVAPGTSCRDQIADGVDTRARHPASVLADRLAGA